MLKEKVELTDEDWALFEIMHSSKDFAEFFIPEPPLKAHDWSGNTHLKLRLYQLPLLSYEFNLVEDDKLSKKENFKRRKALGDLVGRGGRIYGKSMVVIDIDSVQDAILHDGEEHLLVALDLKHLDPRFDFLGDYIQNHPFFSLYTLDSKLDSVNRSKKTVVLKNGHHTFGRIEGTKSPGDGFLGLHPNRKSFEEAQLISMTAFNKQVDTQSELGSVIRSSGVPDGRRDTPFHEDINNKSKRVIWYTSEINPFWDDRRRKDAEIRYGGKNTHAYVTNVLGKEGDIAFGAWDVEDIRSNMTKVNVKHFEVTKDNYDKLLISPVSVINIVPDEKSEFIIQASDIGKSPSECGIFSLRKGKWHLLYRITMRGLVHFQQAKVFHHIADIMRSNIIALDTTEGLGESIAQHLINEKEVEFKNCNYAKRVMPCYFNINLITGYKKNESGEIIFEDKKPVEIKTHSDEYAWIRGMTFFKEQKFVLQDDMDLISQFTAEMAIKGANKTMFTSPIPNHIISMFKVFLLTEWNLNKDKKPTKFHKSDFIGTWLS